MSAAAAALKRSRAAREGPMASMSGSPEAKNARTLRTYEEFWPFYVSQHAAPRTRLLHLIGTALGLVCLILALVLQRWWLLLAVPVVAYAFAWAAHFFIERNRPATFTYPLWSLRGDFQMFGLMLRGRMDEEVRRLR
jgi:hypothetical protein